MTTALVTGAGGFIGGHLVGRLIDDGIDVTACDIKPYAKWEQRHENAYALDYIDLSYRSGCEMMFASPFDDVYHLACNMGGIGFIESNKLACMNSVLIDAHMLDEAAKESSRFFFSSSACVYAAEHQHKAVALHESMAYPADPEDGYGWQKLFTERLCRHYYEETGLETFVARLHNVYGPNGTWRGGREKAPAALCRKVAEASISGGRTISIWGDGEQERTFLYVDDAVEGIIRIMHGPYHDPVNLGSEELVTINQLLDVIEDVAGTHLIREYRLDAPQGVRGRSSDNTRMRAHYVWEPTTKLRDGIEKTYRWVYDQVKGFR